MEDIEIYLNRLADEEEIYAEISEKVRSEITGRQELENYLDNLSGDVKFSLYVSKEGGDGGAVADVVAAFSEHCRNGYEITDDEFLSLVDEEGNILGTSKPRTLVHRDGDLHFAVHIWLIMEKDMGVYVLLQKRSDDKEINPSCYDVSAAGHVPQGEEIRTSAVREMAEELGVSVSESDLHFLSMHRSSYNSGDIHDNELRAVYLCKKDIDIDSLVLQASEVSDVAWAEIDELLTMKDSGDFQNCIDYDELFLIKKAVF